MTAGRAGLYVHVPFCLTRCGYCDFNTYAGLDHLTNPYVEALAREAELDDGLLAALRAHARGAAHALRLLRGGHLARDEDGNDVDGRLGGGRGRSGRGLP